MQKASAENMFYMVLHMKIDYLWTFSPLPAEFFGLNLYLSQKGFIQVVWKGASRTLGCLTLEGGWALLQILLGLIHLSSEL